MERTAQDYWKQVANLPINQKIGTGSDAGHTVNIVDWSSVFPGTTIESAQWVLGYDPIASVWVDEQAQYWSLSDVRAIALVSKVENHEERISALEKK